MIEKRSLYYDFEKKFKDCKKVKFEDVEKTLRIETEFCCKTASELTQYGEELVFALMDNCDARCADNMIILIMRDILQNIDAIEILFKNKAHSSINGLLRNIFERMLIVSYIVSPKKFEIQEKRAYEYYLLNLYERKKYLTNINDIDQKNEIEEEINEIKKSGLCENSDDIIKLFDYKNRINFSRLAKSMKYEKLYKEYYSTLSSNLHGKTVLDYRTLDGECSLLQELRIPFNTVVMLKDYFDITIIIFNLIENYKKNVVSNTFKNWQQNVKKDINKIYNESIRVYLPKDEIKMKKLDKQKYICIS